MALFDGPSVSFYRFDHLPALCGLVFALSMVSIQENVSSSSSYYYYFAGRGGDLALPGESPGLLLALVLKNYAWRSLGKHNGCQGLSPGLLLPSPVPFVLYYHSGSQMSLFLYQP